MKPCAGRPALRTSTEPDQPRKAPADAIPEDLEPIEAGQAQELAPDRPGGRSPAKAAGSLSRRPRSAHRKAPTR